MYEIHDVEIIPKNINEVFEFFSAAQNLEKLTPSQLGFKILTPLPIEMKKGTLIDYKISLHGVPMKWKTLISEWNPPYSFVDEQLKGPYHYWRHKHTFRAINDNQTEVTDTVYYRNIGGSWIHNIFVSPQLKKIFSYRKEQMKTLFA